MYGVNRCTVLLSHYDMMIMIIWQDIIYHYIININYYYMNTIIEYLILIEYEDKVHK